MNSCLREICIFLLGDEAAERFGEWAFGEEFRNLSTIESLSVWHDLHGELLLVDKYSRIMASLPKMIELWINYEREQFLLREEHS